MELKQDGYTVSDDPKLLNVQSIHDFLAHQSYWATDRTFDAVAETLRNSLCFGLYFEGEQIGFARVITDYVAFAYLCDVYVLEEYRNRKRGQFLMECVLRHPRLYSVKWILKTTYAQSFYRRLGFEDFPCSTGWMQRGTCCDGEQRDDNIKKGEA